MDESTRICPWCSTEIPVGTGACPKCGALVEGAIAKEIPGITIVDPEPEIAAGEGLIPDFLDPLSMLNADHGGVPASDPAFDPPSGEVKREMLKMELEAEIRNAGTQVMNPTGDESIEAGAPSEVALAALEAGLLDTSGPEEAAELEELAAPWEDPELEKRVHLWQEQEADKS
jgi:hypothetical protein